MPSTSFSVWSIARSMNGFAFVPFNAILFRTALAGNHLFFARHAIAKNGALCGRVPSWTKIAYSTGLNNLQYNLRKSVLNPPRKRQLLIGASLVAFLSSNVIILLIDTSSVASTTVFQNMSLIFFSWSKLIVTSYIIHFLSMLKQHGHGQCWSLSLLQTISRHSLCRRSSICLFLL